MVMTTIISKYCKYCKIVIYYFNSMENKLYPRLTLLLSFTNFTDPVVRHPKRYPSSKTSSIIHIMSSNSSNIIQTVIRNVIQNIICVYQHLHLYLLYTQICI